MSSEIAALLQDLHTEVRGEPLAPIRQEEVLAIAAGVGRSVKELLLLAADQAKPVHQIQETLIDSVIGKLPVNARKQVVKDTFKGDHSRPPRVIPQQVETGETILNYPKVVILAMVVGDPTMLIGESRASLGRIAAGLQALYHINNPQVLEALVPDSKFDEVELELITGAWRRDGIQLNRSITPGYESDPSAAFTAAYEKLVQSLFAVDDMTEGVNQDLGTNTRPIYGTSRVAEEDAWAIFQGERRKIEATGSLVLPFVLSGQYDTDKYRSDLQETFPFIKRPYIHLSHHETSPLPPTLITT